MQPDKHQIATYLWFGVIAHEFVPKDPDVHIWKGNIYFWGYKEGDKAIEEYKCALQDSPGNLPALQGLAQCYFIFCKYDDAKIYYEQALKRINEVEISSNEVLPEKHIILHQLGLVYHHLGNFEKAKKYYLLALDRDPSSEETKKFLNFAKQAKLLPSKELNASQDLLLRQEQFRHFCRMAWEDGKIEPEENEFLKQIMKDLNLEFSDAKRIFDEARRNFSKPK